MIHRSEGFMEELTGQFHVLENSGELDSEPITRYFPGLCVSSADISE